MGYIIIVIGLASIIWNYVSNLPDEDDPNLENTIDISNQKETTFLTEQQKEILKKKFSNFSMSALGDKMREKFQIELDFTDGESSSDNEKSLDSEDSSNNESSLGDEKSFEHESSFYSRSSFDNKENIKNKKTTDSKKKSYEKQEEQEIQYGDFIENHEKENMHTIMKLKEQKHEKQDHNDNRREEPKKKGIRGDLNIPTDEEEIVYCGYCGAENIVPRGKRGYCCYFCWKELD